MTKIQEQSVINRLVKKVSQTSMLIKSYASFKQKNRSDENCGLSTLYSLVYTILSCKILLYFIIKLKNNEQLQIMMPKSGLQSKSDKNPKL